MCGVMQYSVHLGAGICLGTALSVLRYSGLLAALFGDVNKDELLCFLDVLLSERCSNQSVEVWGAYCVRGGCGHSVCLGWCVPVAGPCRA